VRILELLRRELGRLYRVHITTSAGEALEILAREPIALAIVDQRMPEMSGTELMTRIVSRRPEVVRILLTGYTDLTALVEAINQGQVYRYISKPWEPEELKILVKQGLEKYELEKQNHFLIRDLKRKNYELYRMIDELKRAQADLLRAERLSTVGKMTNMIVHDLKNPLTSIMGLSELLLSAPMVDAEKRNAYYRMINEEGSRILKMTHEILEYVRGEAPEIDHVARSLDEYLEEFRQEAEACLSGSGIALRFQAEASGPVLLDPDRFKRALLNLLDNAREAMAGGGRLTISTAEVKEQVFLRVSDTGSGIPQEAQPYLFEPFFTLGKRNGSGMGLAIVKRIVEAHGGEVRLESSGPGGSTFCIRLPRGE